MKIKTVKKSALSPSFPTKTQKGEKSMTQFSVKYEEEDKEARDQRKAKWNHA